MQAGSNHEQQPARTRSRWWSDTPCLPVLQENSKPSGCSGMTLAMRRTTTAQHALQPVWH